MNVLHYGLQRSGTNYLESLLLKNYHLSLLNIAQDRSSSLHKHCRFYNEKGIIPEPQFNNEIYVDTFSQFESLFKTTPDYYLIISKDPYSWNLSYRNWAKKFNWPQATHHYIEEYNLFYSKFAELSKHSNKFIFIKYKDLLANPTTVLNMLEEKMCLKKRFFSKLSINIPRIVSQSNPFSQVNRSYYLQDEFLTEYKPEDLRRLNSLLDLSLVEFLGYDIHNVVRKQPPHCHT